MNDDLDRFGAPIRGFLFALPLAFVAWVFLVLVWIWRRVSPP